MENSGLKIYDYSVSGGTGVNRMMAPGGLSDDGGRALVGSCDLIRLIGPNEDAGDMYSICCTNPCSYEAIIVRSGAPGREIDQRVDAEA